ncbi:Hypothetical predicted protein [Olea europaea subsp. europaea]|uniref:HMG box domain-containing protein n=1 Tax=Olea europaea subsp. europaea TaxID=158383 RepID=A0A8S0TSH4_OLEEU|nr:Hypothetical predicted protein [Olea europaea subsp. europaea]
MKTVSRGKGSVRKETKETLKPVDDRKLGKRKAAVKADKKPAKKGKAAKKDPNKPKRPPSAFFVFLEEFRKTFKKENPDIKAVSAVGKAGGEKWKSMSAAEKAPYEAKAAKKKAEYGSLMNAYNKKQVNARSNYCRMPISLSILCYLQFIASFWSYWWYPLLSCI